MDQVEESSNSLNGDCSAFDGCSDRVEKEGNFRRTLFGYTGELTANVLKKRLKTRYKQRKLDEGLHLTVSSAENDSDSADELALVEDYLSFVVWAFHKSDQEIEEENKPLDTLTEDSLQAQINDIQNYVRR